MIESTVTTILDRLIKDAEQRFRSHGHRNLCLVTVMPGELVPWDYGTECDDGMLWVRLVTLQPPENDTTLQAQECFTSLSMNIEMGHLFAAAVPNSDGDLPTSHEQREKAVEQFHYMDLMLEALTCTALPGMESVTRLTYNPVGPEGGLTGGIWTGTVGLT